MTVTVQPDDFYDHAEQPDMTRSSHLDDVGLPGYTALVVVTYDGIERLVVAKRDACGEDGDFYLREDDMPFVAPHELTGPLPESYADIVDVSATDPASTIEA